MSAWKPVSIYSSGLQAHMGRDWLCDPAWDIYALYLAPDETLVSPDGSVTQTVFWNRHIDRRFHIEYPRTTKAAPRVRSKTVGDPDREWQIVQEHRDRYLADAGLTLASPPAAIAKCLADTFKYDTYFKGKPVCPTFPEAPRTLVNPIEGLLYKSFCVGCAHAYAVLADACGLACRTIGCGGHRMAEVLVNGRWHMIENSCRHENSRGLEAYFPAGFMEVTLHPGQYANCMPPAKANNYLKSMPSGQYHFMGDTWQSAPTLRFAASNAHALYPELDRWGFKTNGASRLPIVLRAGGFYWENGTTGAENAAAARALRAATYPFPIEGEAPVSFHFFHPFQPGDRLRQSIWLDKLDDMQGVEVMIPVAPEPHLDLTPAFGQQLVVQLGDWKKSLTELGAWPGDPPDNRSLRRCRFTIPTTVLVANAVNWLTLSNETNQTLQAPFIPAAMEPYIEPLLTKS